MSKKLLPVTIISGFLGSGKTTLLNHILKNQVGLKTAVLVNEFGEIGIDNDLIIEGSEDMIELNNGCICCSINGELLNTVSKVLERAEKLDYLIVETTGLADPLPVAMTFAAGDLREKVSLDSIITVIDGENFDFEINNTSVAYSQILYGDILLLNKSDLVNLRLINFIFSFHIFSTLSDHSLGKRFPCGICISSDINLPFTFLLICSTNHSFNLSLNNFFPWIIGWQNGG